MTFDQRLASNVQIVGSRAWAPFEPGRRHQRDAPIFHWRPRLVSASCRFRSAL